MKVNEPAWLSLGKAGPYYDPLQQCAANEPHIVKRMLFYYVIPRKKSYVVYSIH